MHAGKAECEIDSLTNYRTAKSRIGGKSEKTLKTEFLPFQMYSRTGFFQVDAQAECACWKILSGNVEKIIALIESVPSHRQTVD